MFVRTSSKKLAESQAEPNNVVQFLETVAINKKGEKRFASVVFEGSTYRVLKYDNADKSWDLRHLDGNGPKNLSIPVSLFNDFCKVISED